MQSRLLLTNDNHLSCPLYNVNKLHVTKLYAPDTKKMNLESASRTNTLSKFLSDLYQVKKSGIVTIVDKKFSIKFFLDSGLLVHVDGLAMVNAKLVYQVCQVKGLDSSQSKKLLAIGKRAPHALGKFLVENSLIKKDSWHKFLIMRAKYHIEAAIRMVMPKFSFSETLSPVPEDNMINIDFFDILVNSIRGIEEDSFFRNYLPGPGDIFGRAKNIASFKTSLQLTQNEKKLLLAFQNAKTTEEALKSSDLTQSDFSRSFYLLQFLGLISPSSRRTPAAEEKEEKSNDLLEAINLYLDFFNIISANLRKELGKECERIFDKTRESVTGKGTEIFQMFDPLGEDRAASVSQISNHFSQMISSGESPMILPTTFNNFLYPLISSMRRLLGIEITTHTLNEMIKVVGYAKKFKSQDELINHIEKKIQDYLYQL